MNSTSASSAALFLADNLALDFINSEYGVGEQRHDCLADDQGVANWLNTAGQLPRLVEQKVPHGLLAKARELRDCSRAVVNAAMEGTTVDLTLINQVLEAGRPVRKLEWDNEVQQFRVGVHQRDASAASLLWPVAESLVRLVTSDKFEFVRQCEAHDCVLLFHDLSKSHRRRWCSMATCGNRMKVAAFRSRKKPE
ncbi:ABATE domain-containing protein [Pseudomonas sp. CDFA 602]|uniref:CGNR zinc finger domain-containing protein n=1 Tax=Pseudomonas californiensis TaxID=2829823 RepID=UPI001E52D25F|nr:ABATE domain-containing protein [Pseudomonas californiensis]MCD5993805.1 ABATE domain-containing protein [Pseudomonas californiensis]MCD5999400.1 ABATE domain-containing protein [Pseudomonas californiensis]